MGASPSRQTMEGSRCLGLVNRLPYDTSLFLLTAANSNGFILFVAASR